MNDYIQQIVTPLVYSVQALPQLNVLAVVVLFGIASLLLLKSRQTRQTDDPCTGIPTYDEIPDTILHHMATKKELMNLKDIDVAIVGSGIGALSTASILSRCGYKVVVFEQHYTVGGSTHMYKEAGYEFDVGVHYVGGELDSKHSVFRWMFDLIS